MLVYIDNIKYEYELKALAAQFKCDSVVFQIVESIAQAPVTSLSENQIILFCESCSCIGKYFIGNEECTLSENKLEHEDSLKNSYKRLFYKILIRLGFSAPDWGILTGIRPTKLYSEVRMIRPHNEDEVSLFNRAYLVSEEKSKILEKIFNIQSKILDTVEPNDYSIYISVPFCPTRCNYCTFFSNEIQQKSHLIENYLRSLEQELKGVLRTEWVHHRNLTSIYIGGGTPSSLSAEDLKLFFEILSSNIDIGNVREITFEAGRADTITKQKLQIIKASGVNRISINPQSMVDKTLRQIGRSHSSGDVLRAYRLARSIGFDNINMDIILGLEGETQQDVEYTIEQLLNLEPESITVHSLALKKASVLSKSITSESANRQSALVEQMMGKVYEYLTEEYDPYYLYRQKNILGGQENIGFSKSGFESLYNILIIEEYQNILSFGPGAISRFVYPQENRVERVSNTKNLEEYINNLDQYINKKKQEMRM